MSVVTIPKLLREKLGDDATEGLVQFINEATKDARDNVILLAEEKFEKRLTQETSRLEKRITEEVAKLEIRITEEVAKLEIRITEEASKLRVDMAAFKTEIIKWMFLFWIGQIAIVAGLFKLLK